MAKQLKIIAILFAITIVSTWVLYWLSLESSVRDTSAYNVPDYFMEDFIMLTMDENGDPKYKLHAIYMAHYTDNDTTEVLRPSMEFYRNDKSPLYVKADKGWLTADNEVVLLNGDVEFVKKNEFDQTIMQINTEKAQLLINQYYAETDEFVKISIKRTTITGIGMQANFNEGKLTVLSDVHTIIEPE